MFEEQNSGCGKMDTGYKPSCGVEKRTYSVGDIQVRPHPARAVQKPKSREADSHFQKEL